MTAIIKLNEHAKALSLLATEARKKIPKEKRIEIARKAGSTRWKNHKKGSKRKARKVIHSL